MFLLNLKLLLHSINSHGGCGSNQLGRRRSFSNGAMTAWCHSSETLSGVNEHTDVNDCVRLREWDLIWQKVGFFYPISQRIVVIFNRNIDSQNTRWMWSKKELQTRLKHCKQTLSKPFLWTCIQPLHHLELWN